MTVISRPFMYRLFAVLDKGRSICMPFVFNGSIVNLGRVGAIGGRGNRRDIGKATTTRTAYFGRRLRLRLEMTGRVSGGAISRGTLKRNTILTWKSDCDGREQVRWESLNMERKQT